MHRVKLFSLVRGFVRNQHRVFYCSLISSLGFCCGASVATISKCRETRVDIANCNKLKIDELWVPPVV